MSDKPTLGWFGTLVVLALVVALLIFIRNERRAQFEKCMAERHDRFLCSTYANSTWRYP